MIITIKAEPGYVSAMGHRVPLEHGGEPELKRRCLESIARINDPPDLIQFNRAGLAVDAEADAARADLSARLAATEPITAVMEPVVTAQQSPTEPATPEAMAASPVPPVRRRHRAKPPSERP